MHKFASPTSCYSGECGNCNRCNPIHKACKEPDNYSVSFAKDLCKFYKKEELDKQSEEYSSYIKKWCVNQGYLKPGDSGSAREKIKLNVSWVESNNVEFNLLKKKHDGLCSNIICNMNYLQCPVWTRDRFFPIIPMYVSSKDKNIKYCIKCVEDQLKRL
tara:strand:+ start:22 stop:498 length:477 start_codon:yes stop_codon:yes gene_type:complete